MSNFSEQNDKRTSDLRKLNRMRKEVIMGMAYGEGTKYGAMAGITSTSAVLCANHFSPWFKKFASTSGNALYSLISPSQ